MLESDVLTAAFADAIALHERVKNADPRPVIDAAVAVRTALAGGGKLLLFGNGGSAADAQHAAAELVGRFARERGGLAAVALTSDSSIVTSVANDYGYERVFARQIEALGKPGDVAFGISTSGRSKNVEAALASGKTLGMLTIALTGRDGGRMGADADIHLNVAEASTARIQEVHRTIIHAICLIVDRRVGVDPTA